MHLHTIPQRIEREGGTEEGKERGLREECGSLTTELTGFTTRARRLGNRPRLGKVHVAQLMSIVTPSKHASPHLRGRGGEGLEGE